MKIRAKRDFQYGNEDLEEGEVYELPDSVAEQAIEKDYAEKAEEEEEKEEEEKPQLRAAEEEREEETPRIEKGEEESSERVEAGTSEDEEGLWGEMEERLDEKPEVPDRWNPARDDVKSGEVSAEDVDDLLGVVKRLDVHRKYDTPMAVIETRDGEEVTVFQQKAIEDLFKEMARGDRVAIRFIGLEKSGSGYEYLNYRYELRDPDGEVKISG